MGKSILKKQSIGKVPLQGDLEGLKIGIFGGSFNPVHNGHLALARGIREIAGLDEVWLMVSPQNPFKVNQTLMDDSLRLEMVKVAVQDDPGLRVSDFEFHLPKPSYTWNTLQALAEAYPEHTFTLLIGGDNWTRFDRWYRHEDILSKYRIVVYPRADDPITDSQLPENVTLAHLPLVNISSTEIRKRLRNGQSIDGLTPPAVVDLLREEMYLCQEK